MKYVPWVLLAVVLLVAIVPGGFASFIVKSENPTPGSLAETASLEAWWWGIVNPETPATKCESGIDQVRFYRTFLQSVAAVASLGVWIPTEVEWTCAKPHPATGSTG